MSYTKPQKGHRCQHLLATILKKGHYEDMNRLESAIRSVMHDIGLQQLPEVADKTGITKSALYKILRGDIGLSAENLRRLSNLSAQPSHQFSILAAHLYNEAERGSSLADKISIEFTDTPAGISFADLPEKLQIELRAIGDEIKNGDADLGGAIAWFARAINSTPETISFYPIHPEGESLSFVAEEPAPYGTKTPASDSPPRKKS